MTGSVGPTVTSPAPEPQNPKWLHCTSTVQVCVFVISCFNLKFCPHVSCLTFCFIPSFIECFWPFVSNSSISPLGLLILFLILSFAIFLLPVCLVFRSPLLNHNI